MSQDRLDLSTDPELISDPYATLVRLREEEPVRRVDFHGVPAWLESQIAFASLLARCDDIRLAVPAAALTYRITPNIRSLTAMPVTFTQT